MNESVSSLRGTMASKIMTIPEIESAYKKLSNDPNMRALSAVLRIGAEQIERRGRLGVFRNLVFITACLAIIFTIVAATPLVPQKVKAALLIWEYVSVGICVASVGILWRVRGKLDAYLADQTKIRSMMVEYAQRIVGVPNFNPTPLSEELRGTLREALRKQGGGSSDLEAIVDRS
jgi:hypothetical protein